MSWRELFPYDPYPAQIEFIDDVSRIVGSGGVLLAEACNGFGKTASALSALLSLGRRIVYATRTHEQVRQVLSEVEAINMKAGASFKAVNLASREHLCLNEECRDLPLREAQEVCRSLRGQEDCIYGSEISRLPGDLKPVLDPEALMEAGRQKEVCPYFLARAAAKHSDVVVAPYIYVFDKIIRSSVGLDLHGRSLVLDEGHNLDKVGQETLSDTLSVNLLEAAAKELKAVGRSQRYLKLLIGYLKERTSEEPEVDFQSLERSLELTLGIDLNGLYDFYIDAVASIRALKLQRGETPVCYLNGVLSFIRLVALSVKEKYITVFQRSQHGVETVEYRCMDPSLAVMPVIEEAAGTLVMSGTLSPMDLFSDIVGVEHAERKAYPPIQSSDKIRMIIDARVSTRFKDRNESMILEIGVSVAGEMADVPNGALIFFPQRRFMSKCLDAWGVNSIIEVHEGKLYLAGKSVFVEGRDASENREVVERYKKASSSVEGAVLCCVFRGRNSEGSNFPDEQARGIFLVGVPFANYSDPIVHAQIRYLNGVGEGLGRRWYMMDAFRAANQAMGRGIRSREDWCHYWLLDHRYAENVNLLSRWAQGAGPEIRD